jgi:hypothetical protein
LEVMREFTEKDIERRHNDMVHLTRQSQEEIAKGQDRLDKLLKVYSETTGNVEADMARVANAHATASEAAERAKEATDKLATLLNTLEKRNVLSSSDVESQNKSPATDLPKPIVYFQFAGFTREEAIAISKGIADAGWRLPGQVRIAAAANTNQIRFNPLDEKIAERLKRDADEALKKQGFNIVLTLQPNNIVKPGIPEIWIYKP